MKIRNFLALFLFVGLAFTSCKKDDSKDGDGEKSTDPFESEYSDLTVAENKENLEKTGMEMLNEIKQLEKSEAVDVMMNFSFESIGNESVSPAFLSVMSEIAEIGKDDFETSQMFSVMKSTAEEPNTFTELWNEVVGKYSWNSSTQSWDESILTDAVIFEFPGKEGETTNTATITINNFGAFTLKDPLVNFDDSVPELPTSLKVSLKYQSTELASYSFSASYKDNGMPTSLSTKLTIDDFSWSVDMVHTPFTEASLTGSFKHSENVLVEGHVDATGDWSQSNLENNIEEHKDFVDIDYFSGDTIYDTWTEVMIENILENANAYIQLMDIKIAGMVDVDSLATEIRAIEKKYPDPYENNTMKESVAAEVVAFNKYAHLIVVYSSSNEMMAKVEGYAVQNEQNAKEWYMDMRFVFGDESKADAETFFSEGFSDLVGDINSFIETINSEYESNIDDVEL